MNPDLLVEQAVDLVVSYVTGNDIVLGRRRTARDVALMLEALDIYINCPAAIPTVEST